MFRYEAQPLTESCTEKLADTTHVCVGISPFNSYYSAQRIASLVEWAVDTYPAAHFFVPDEGPAYTFQACGYTPQKAAQKARKQAKCVVNRIIMGMEEAGLEPDEDLIVTAATLRESSRYMDLAAQARRMFADDAVFREATMTTSEWVLAGYLPAGTTPTLAQKELAVQYFLDELPMFLDTPGILGVENSTFVYHQRVPFLVRLFSGELDIHPAPGQSFTVLADVADLVHAHA